MIDGHCHCGKISWRLDAVPAWATACNCTLCRRYGALWAYGHEDETIRVSGATRSYARPDGRLAFHFCPDCACVAYWRALSSQDGRRRMAVNLRLAEPNEVSTVSVKHLDGLDTWTDQPRDGRSVGDMWF